MEIKPPLSRKLAVIIIGLFLIFGGYQYYSLRLISHNEADPAPQQPAANPEPPEPRVVTIHVVGAVDKPGVYTLTEDKRINDAVLLAEPTEKADLSLINMAAPLQDGKQVYVPAKGDKTIRSPSLGAAEKQGKININRAGAAELDRLKGIGPALAQRIIEHRESKGPFASVEDITQVKGIGTALLAKIRDDICVD